MGSALAPVLCTLVASTTEFLWLRDFRSTLFNIGLCTAVRYADNRAFHFHEGLRQNAWTQLLPNLEFYGPPILLEYVHEEKFLGTVCSVVQGTITTCQPSDSTVLRTLQSVGSREHVLSGFSARIRTIIRLARPMRLIRPQVEDLIEIYQGRGFSHRCLVQIAQPLLNSVGILSVKIPRTPTGRELVASCVVSLSLSLPLSLSLSLHVLVHELTYHSQLLWDQIELQGLVQRP